MPTESQFISFLEENTMLKDVFISICNYSAEKLPIGDGYRWKIEAKSIGEITKQLLTDHLDAITKEGIIFCVEYLISTKLIKYIDLTEAKKEEISVAVENQVEAESDAETQVENKVVKLTNRGDFILCSGIQLYEAFLRIDEREKQSAIFEKRTTEFFENLQRPLNERIEKLSEEVEESKKIVEKTTRESLIKNIEIISLFTAVITILISNAFGFVGAESVEIKKIIGLNFSIIFSLVILIAFTQTMILDRKLDRKTLILLIIALVELAALVVVFIVR